MKQEETKETERKADVRCPVCKSTNIEVSEKRNDNGILGPGYRSWIVDSKCVCADCGVFFKKVKGNGL